MEKIVVASGKRKNAVAKVKLVAGNGKITFNSRPYKNLEIFQKLTLSEPVEIAKKALGKFDFDVIIRARGGGKEGQMQAARLGLAKALVKFTESKDLKEAYLKYDRRLLVADVRRKEAYKPGDSKARAKRQKSYR